MGTSAGAPTTRLGRQPVMPLILNISLLGSGMSVMISVVLMCCFLFGVAAVVFGILPLGGALLLSLLAGCFYAVVIGVINRKSQSTVMPQVEALLAHGETAEAVVLDRWKGPLPDEESTWRQGYIAYAFNARSSDGSTTHVVRAEYATHGTEHLAAGTSLPVHYLLENHSIAMLEPHYQACRSQNTAARTADSVLPPHTYRSLEAEALLLNADGWWKVPYVTLWMTLVFTVPLSLVAAALGRDLVEATVALVCIQLVSWGGIIAHATYEGRRKALPAIAALHRQHATATATIIDRWRPMTTATYHNITYRFDVEGTDGSRTTIIRVEPTALGTRRLRVGDEGTVYYLPEQPEICMLEPHYRVSLKRQQGRDTLALPSNAPATPTPARAPERVRKA